MIDYTAPLDLLPDPLPIEPLRKPFDVTITPPGSKSITCRAYVLAALAKGESRISRPLRADDTDLLLKALCTLGAEAQWAGDDVVINGVNGRFPRGGSVNLGDGGTPTRFMIACACLAAEPVTVDGSPRMRERPIAEGVDMLRQLGAKIEYLDQEGRLPVRVAPSEAFVGGEVSVGRTQSSQFISAVLMIAPTLNRGVSIQYQQPITSESYVQLTRGMLSDWAVALPFDYRRGQLGAEWVAPTSIRARDYAIEPDASSAVYWVQAAAICPGSRVKIMGIADESVQPDLNIVVYLECAGIFYDHRSGGLLVCGPDRYKGMNENASHSPDAALALGCIAANATSLSHLFGLRTLRVKETDRIAALANELRRIGCTVKTGDDWITINPSTRHNHPVVIETYNDHRIAMAFAVLGLARPGLSIRNPACVSKSYPTFWQDFAKLYAD